MIAVQGWKGGFGHTNTLRVLTVVSCHSNSDFNLFTSFSLASRPMRQTWRVFHWAHRRGNEMLHVPIPRCMLPMYKYRQARRKLEEVQKGNPELLPEVEWPRLDFDPSDPSDFLQRRAQRGGHSEETSTRADVCRYHIRGLRAAPLPSLPIPMPCKRSTTSLQEPVHQPGQRHFIFQYQAQAADSKSSYQSRIGCGRVRPLIGDGGAQLRDSYS